jgi:PAS domain S-box-containing protein
MEDRIRTNAELLEEISVLKRKIQELEQAGSEYKRIAEAYEDSEFKYRTLIEHSSDVVFCVDRKGEYKFVNQVFALTFGKTPDYFIGKTFWDVYPKEHADHRQAASSKVFATGESQSVEVVVPLPDRTLYYIAKANPVRDEKGNVVLNLTHAIDITDRKQAEEALGEERRRLKQALDEVKTLRGIVPICAHCKKIRDDRGYWQQVEQYVSEHTDATFSHGICPICLEREMKELKAHRHIQRPKGKSVAPGDDTGIELEKIGQAERPRGK